MKKLSKRFVDAIDTLVGSLFLGVWIISFFLIMIAEKNHVWFGLALVVSSVVLKYMLKE